MTPHDASEARSAVEHRPADVVPHPLVVEDELANRLRQLVALPAALASPCALALAFWCGSTCGLDRIRGRAEFVRGDVRDTRRLASSVRGVPCCPTQVSGRAHGVATRGASLGHCDLATHPGAGLLDRQTWSQVRRLNRLEEAKDVLRARRCPQGEELMIRIGKRPAAADRHETRVAVFREDQSQHALLLKRAAAVPGKNSAMEHVLGIGGHFIRAADPVALAAWYRDCLGLDADENGKWRQEPGPTVFATFESDTGYFGSRTQQTMLNFRVRDLDARLAQLRAKGANVAEEIQEFDGIGRFSWVTDPEGNRVELWQPS